MLYIFQQKLLGKLRIEFTNVLENNNLKIRSSGYNFLWLIDFPLFEVNESQLLESMHHPFTQPHPEDMKYLVTKHTFQVWIVLSVYSVIRKVSEMLQHFQKQQKDEI